jgi:mannosyl-oligosaccharide alpha-1,2-mannosidase
MSDVNAVGGGSHYDNEESFLFAEVLKYAYLTHAEGKSLTFKSSSIVTLS